MRSLFLAALTTLSLASGCSSSESSSAAPGSDAGTTGDGATGGDAAGEVGLDPTNLPKCGTAPYVVMSGLIQIQEIAGLQPAAGAKMTASCSTTPFTVGEDGKYAIAVQKDLTGYVKLEAMGAIPALLGDFKVVKDEVVNLTLLPAIFKGFIDGWKDGEPAVFVAMDPKATSGVCSEKDGVSLTLIGQPTGVLRYFAEGSVPSIDPAATKTSKSGFVAITGVTGTHVELTAAKAGCTAVLPAIFTGKLRIEPNIITETKINLTDP